VVSLSFSNSRLCPGNYGNGFPSFTVLQAIDETLDGNGFIARQLNVLATTARRGLSLSL
jgi:hypothetical protein